MRERKESEKKVEQVDAQVEVVRTLVGEEAAAVMVRKGMGEQPEGHLGGPAAGAGGIGGVVGGRGAGGAQTN
ncbi:hypothetical protein LTS18_003388 [Coniosporium uncinatum]|uniref:Uncharacterized protein n=1 Tax=Coniosporium uncinatum TaxID=93489 RepID=A0ACC3DZ98_9PEZI|nr:hypothetical protein LTS18_003388 [Coniosporium uncinatum]